MASETGPDERSRFIETLINSRNRDIGFFLPLFIGLNLPANPSQETQNHDSLPDRIILVNPFTQGMVVVSRNSSNNSFESFLDDLISGKKGQPPASKASIDALPTVEIVAKDDEQCVVCLEEWKEGEKGVEMPCKHKFHKECVEKWLKIHGSCPVCRYEMPVDETYDEEKRIGSEEGDGERRRETWVWLTFGGRRSEESERLILLTSVQDS